jgi:hypothetical protein
MRKGSRTWTALALASLLVGCGTGDSKIESGAAGKVSATPPGSAQGLDIQFASRPDPPAAARESTFEVTARRQDGSSIDDATVTAVFSMPAMPSMNMPAMKSTVTLTPQGSGRYRGTGNLSMSGTWYVTITVARGAEELGRRELSVVAR